MVAVPWQQLQNNTVNQCGIGDILQHRKITSMKVVRGVLLISSLMMFAIT